MLVHANEAESSLTLCREIVPAETHLATYFPFQNLDSKALLTEYSAFSGMDFLNIHPDNVLSGYTGRCIFPNGFLDSWMGFSVRLLG